MLYQDIGIVEKADKLVREGGKLGSTPCPLLNKIVLAVISEQDIVPLDSKVEKEHLTIVSWVTIVANAVLYRIGWVLLIERVTPRGRNLIMGSLALSNAGLFGIFIILYILMS